MTSEQKNNYLVKSIKVFQIESDCSFNDLAQNLRMHPNTLRNKMRTPDMFTYFELKILSKLMKMSEEQKAMLL